MLPKTVFVMTLIMGLAGAAPASGERYALEVKGLACPFCAYGIEKKLKGLEGVESVQVDIEKGRVVVTAASQAQLSGDQLRQAVKDAGFTLDGFEKLGEAEKGHD